MTPRCIRYAAASLAVPCTLLSQSPPRAGRSPTYLQRYQEVTRMAPLPAQSAAVANLVIAREGVRLTLTRGRLHLLSPVDGRTVGALFRGDGRFAFAPPVAAEQQALRRHAGTASLDEPISEAILLFTDSTLAQLGRLTFAPGELERGAVDRVRDFMESLRGSRDETFNSDVMEPLINGTAGFLLARLERPRGDALLVMVNPSLSEAVRLYRPVNRREWGGRSWAVVSQFDPPGQPLSAGWFYRGRLRIPSYRISARLSEQFSADVRVIASAAMTLVAEQPVGPWLRFTLDHRCDIDSARWSSGEAAATFKADEDSDLWVLAPRALRLGDSLELTVHYHGTTVERFGDWFFVDPLAAWYPLNGQGADLATFDITYTSNPRWTLVSIGERTESTTTAAGLVTRWVTSTPTTHATFNMGLFDIFQARYPDSPPLDVLLSERAHDLLARNYLRLGVVIPRQRNMSQSVAADMSNSFQLFTTLFGDPPHRHYFVTEIPADHGVSFPGIIHLSWGTFQDTQSDGFDEYFRAHEAAHQWWGNAVRPASYRDAWLSEGLATFSGLWYLQTVRRRNTEYYRYLDRYRANILTRRSETGPITLGYRNRTPVTPGGYHVIVYEKGAWVFHMLRVLMMDLSTLRSDRLMEVLREYYTTYRGGAASTDDFRRIAERHMGAPLDWFFDQWVHGGAIPRYRVAWTSEPAEGGRFRVKLRIHLEDVPAGFTMPVLVAADLGDNRTARFRVTVSAAQTEYVGPLLPARPREIRFNEFHSVLAEVSTADW